MQCLIVSKTDMGRHINLIFILNVIIKKNIVYIIYITCLFLESIVMFLIYKIYLLENNKYNL